MLLKDRLIPSSDRTYTDEGFLVLPARIARTGIQEYYAFEMGLSDRKPDEVVRVYRPADEVFSEDSLKSFANKPLTDDHPPELVDSSNFRKYAVGHSGPQVSQDGMFATAILHFTDAEAIKKIESGKVELSNGYKSDIEWTSGVTPDGEQYDAIQRNIRGNHIALVVKGRCGPSCKVADNKPTDKSETIMKIVIDGVDFEVSDQVAQAVGKLQRDLKDAEKEAEDTEEEMKKKEDEEAEMKKDHQKALDTLQAKLDDALAKVPTADQLDKLMANRMKTVDAALKILPDLKWEGKDCETIRKEVVAAKCSGIQVDSVSADYVRARFDMLAEHVADGSDRTLDEALKQQIAGGAAPKKSMASAARDAAAERARNAWKGGSK